MESVAVTDRVRVTGLSTCPCCMSDIMCVQEHVPSGAGTVLINRTHTYNDPLLAMGTAEKKLVDAIDEPPTIGKTLHGMLSATDSVMRIGA